MIETREQYLVDNTGARVGVLLDIEIYRKLLDALEELECIRAYDEAKASSEDFIPFEEAVKNSASRAS